MPDTYREFQKFFKLAIVDAQSHRAWGIATSEAVDKAGELCDYRDTKPEYQAWSQEAFDSTTRAGQKPSLGNVRLQHGLEIAGKATKLEYRDEDREIWLESEPLPTIWPLLENGNVTGYSQGGKYLYRRCNVCRTEIFDGSYCPKCEKVQIIRYSARPSEVSYVDSPCLGEARFEWVKAELAGAMFKYIGPNGSTELRKFSAIATIIDPAKAEKTKRVDGEDLTASAFLIVVDAAKTDTWNLPWKFSTDAKTKRHLRDALTRFNQLKDVPNAAKKKAWKRLIALCKKYDIEVTDEHAGKAAAGASWPSIDLSQLRKLQKMAGGSLKLTMEEVESSAATCEQHAGVAVLDRVIEKGSDGSFLDLFSECYAEITGEAFKAQPRHPGGQFASRASGPMHDCLTAAGFEHSRTGTSSNVGGESQASSHYTHENGSSVSVAQDESWTHSDGKGRSTSGKGKDALETHLQSCRSQKKARTVMDLSKLAQQIRDMVSSDSIAIVDMVDGKVAAVHTNVRKDMFHISVLAQLLQEIRYLQQSVQMEGEYEGDDRDSMIAVDLKAWLATGVAILQDVVTDETSELLAATGKAVLNSKGEEAMFKKNFELLKAAHKSLSGHFSKMAAHNDSASETHDAAAESHGALADAHKAAGKACKADVGDDDTNASGAAVHKASVAHHGIMKAHHEKMAKLCKSMADHCNKMAESHNASEKALGVAMEKAEDGTLTIVEVQKAIETGQQAMLDGVKELLKTAAPAQGVTVEQFDTFKTDLTKTIGEKVTEEIGKLPELTKAKSGAGSTDTKLFSREGKELDASKTEDDDPFKG